MKILRGRQYSFKQQAQFTMLTMVLDPLASNINDSLTQTTLHLPFTSMGRFGPKVIFLLYENSER
jgi:hypothetical protein